MLRASALLAALSIQLPAAHLIAEEDVCETLQEAIVCSALFPWKRVTEFPYAYFEEKPDGWAAVFHLDGRGVGIVQSLDEIETPNANNAEWIANYWVENLFDEAGIVLTGAWIKTEGLVDGVLSSDRLVTFEQEGRTRVMRGSFVSTARGDLMIWSILNEMIDLQAGDYLHKGLISSVSLR